MVNIRKRDDAGLRGGWPVPVLPMVFYRGRGEWTAPTDLIDAPAGLEAQLHRFGHVLRNIGRNEAALDARRSNRPPGLDLALRAPGLAFASPLAQADIERLLERLPHVDDADDFALLCVKYIIEVIEASPQMLQAALRGAKRQEREALMGTAAQAWLDEGRVEGQADFLLHMLERRFGPLPPEAAERVRGSPPEDIRAFADAVLDAPDLQSVPHRAGG